MLCVPIGSKLVVANSFKFCDILFILQRFTGKWCPYNLSLPLEMLHQNFEEFFFFFNPLGLTPAVLGEKSCAGSSIKRRSCSDRIAVFLRALVLLGWRIRGLDYK